MASKQCSGTPGCHPKPVSKRPMVGWYDPGQLIKTGIQVLISTIFGRHSDYRLIEGLSTATPEDDYYDYRYFFNVDSDGNPTLDKTRERKAIWIDYVSDVGDGWNPTYTLAYYLAQENLLIKRLNEITERGSILIFGGDEVYPAADRLEYKQRLEDPYSAALRCTIPPNHPHLFAIPGNHDWYDSLVSFTRLFCLQRWFGGWKTRQCRSYFALRLPQNWWLWGVDVQLSSDIDWPQVEYFKRAAAHMVDGDKIILCLAEPHWIYAKVYGQKDEAYSEKNLTFLEQKILGGKKEIMVYLAGDLHHYRRHQDPGGKQKITAGGGGAFLHPTHGPNVEHLKDDFELQQPTYPTIEKSKSLCFRNLKFFAYNPKFGYLAGVLYLLIAWIFVSDFGQPRIPFSIPAKFISFLVFIGLFVLFTDTHFPKYRWLAGISHGVANILGCYWVGKGAIWITNLFLPEPFKYSPVVLWIHAVLIYSGGWILGSFIMGLYLLILLNGFERHGNEAFSSLKIQDWKSFLRMKIDEDGNLTIYPIGIERVPRKWKFRKTHEGPEWQPNDDAYTAPELIEPPIKIRSV